MAAKKSILILLTVFVFCYCAETNKTAESRAKKNKTALRVIVAFVVLVLSKLALSKISMGFIFWLFFQKFFYIIGLVFSYLMKTSQGPVVSPLDQNSLTDYNTVGYSYGTPDTGHKESSTDTTYGPPEWGYNRKRKHVNL